MNPSSFIRRFRLRHSLGKVSPNGMKRRVQKRAARVHGETIASIAKMQGRTVELAKQEDIVMVVVVSLNRNPTSL